MIIAIDGPAGSGKSTTAKAVARALGFLYLDTGAMYRAVALAVLRLGKPFEEEAIREVLAASTFDVSHEGDAMHIWLDGEDVSEEIRTPEVGQHASAVATQGFVRDALVKMQRRIGEAYAAGDGGVVLDGRDIGTVVFPHADLKVFMVADAKVRAQRRHEELAGRGVATTFEAVLAEIEQRDKQDRERAIAPLRRAEDAVDLDTTARTIDEQVQFVVEKARERAENKTVENDSPKDEHP